MFQSPDITLIVEFIFMFYKEKPIDWLLDHILWVKVCNPEKDAVSLFFIIKPLKCFHDGERVGFGELEASILCIMVTACPERVLLPTKVLISEL